MYMYKQTKKQTNFNLDLFLESKGITASWPPCTYLGVHLELLISVVGFSFFTLNVGVGLAWLTCWVFWVLQLDSYFSRRCSLFLSLVLYDVTVYDAYFFWLQMEKLLQVPLQESGTSFRLDSAVIARG